MKKGFVLQFTWIFVIIAGAIILAFFFGLAQKQRSISEAKLSVTLSRDLENILTSAMVSRGTSQTLPVPSQGIAFECTEGCDCGFRVGSMSKPFGDLVVFSSGYLDEGDGLVWSLDWSVPFRVTNFLYVISPSTKFYFVSDSHDYFSNRLLSEIVEKIPPSVDYEILTPTDVPSIEDEGYADVRFVFLNLDAMDFTLDDSFEDADVSSVSFDDSFVYFAVKENGEVIFTPMRQFSYAGLPMVFAGIFSSDYFMFDCQIRNVLKKLKYTSMIVADRSEELQSLADAANRPCVYSAARSALAREQEVAGNARLEDLASASADLERANRDLVQRSCPELF